MMTKQEFRTNNFDFIRLFAAMQVVIGHGLHHLGIGISEPVSAVLAAFPGVPIFFVISGFLISASWERSPSLSSYTKNRFLRIYPALWVCFGISVLSVIIFYEKSIPAGQFAVWAAAQLSFAQFYNPEFLRGYGVGVLNGSLWTIPVEVQFYIALPFIYLILDRIGWRKIVTASAFILMVAFTLLHRNFIQGSDVLYLRLIGVSVAPYLFMFFIGVVLQKNQPLIKRHLKDKFWTVFTLYCLSSLIIYKMGFNHGTNAINPVSAVLLSLVVISLAYSFQGRLGALLKGNDISYGVYIYHMVWVNILVHSSPLPALINLAVMIVLTVISAYLSWRFIEKPALLLKNFSLKKQSVSQNKPASAD